MIKYTVKMYERDETTNWQWRLYPQFTQQVGHKYIFTGDNAKERALECAKEKQKMYTHQIKFEVEEVE